MVFEGVPIGRDRNGMTLLNYFEFQRYFIRIDKHLTVYSIIYLYFWILLSNNQQSL